VGSSQKGSEADLPKENKVSSAKSKSTPDTAEGLNIEFFKRLPCYDWALAIFPH